MKSTKEYFLSPVKHLRIDLKFNLEEIKKEAIRLKDRYFTHRDGGYEHQGWRSLVLHGLSENKTSHWKDYGYSTSIEAYQNMRWTDAAKECPKTMDFLLNHFPCQHFGRVRFMLLEAGGHIGTHVDSRAPILENTNISLTNPEGCIWNWGDGEKLFMDPGNAYVMNIHYPHGIVNDSKEDRYHLIIHRFDCTEEWKQLINKSCAEQGISGEWIEHEVLV